MKVKCPVCKAEYDLEPGKYQCQCGAKFSVEGPDAVAEADAPADDDLNKTIAPRRHVDYDPAGDRTMPGKRDRKPDGRFDPGDLIMGRYKVLSELGQGGMGVVYKCFDETAGIEIALKALPPELSHSTEEMEDIRDNFQLVAKLVHQNIAISKNLERDNSNGNYYLIMECVEGEGLQRWIRHKRKDGTLDLESVLPVIRQVADALDYAHEQKIIHRDIKPGNIMIDSDGHVKVLDFGLAAQIHTSMTRVSMAYHGTSGTGPYMAPEQWRGRAQGAAADQYALAVMTYEMLAGHLPFESTDATVLREAVLNDTPEELKDMPACVRTAVARAMSKDPAERFASCADFVAALAGKKFAKAKIGGSQKKRFPLAALAGKKFAKAKIGGSQKKRFLLISVAVIAVLALIAGLLVVIGLSTDNTDDDPSGVLSTDSPSPEASAAPSQQQANVSPSAEASAAPTKQMIQLPGNVRLEMVKVKAGMFTMGSPYNEAGRFDDEELHQVTLTKDFYIGETEVTQAQWKAVMGNNPSYFRGDDLPVEQVSWDDAMSFCEKLNDMGKAPSGWKFTLPTEAQWEYAARERRKSRGYKYSGSNNIDEVAWYFENSGRKTHPVRTKKPNELGLYDMSGNVWEWCLDWHETGYADNPETLAGNSGSVRVYRGGSWLDNARGCRSAYRGSSFPGGRFNFLGFRLALVPVR